LDTTAAAKLVGEAADITRFKSRDAYDMWAGTAPIPVWSANKQRFRLNQEATDRPPPQSTGSQ
jgi:transposase